MIYRVFKNGDHIEIYEYERMPGAPDKSSKDDKEKENESPNKTDPLARKEERRKQTLRDASNDIRRRAREYFGNDDFFVTLTVAKNSNDVGYYDLEFKNFIKRLSYKHGKVSYLGVRELQGRGAIHYHFLFKNKYMSDMWDSKSIKRDSEEQKEFERYLAGIWRHGFTKVYQITGDISDIGGYIVKYMSKDLGLFQGHKAFLNSRDIKKSPAIDIREDEQVLEIIRHIQDYKKIALDDANQKKKRIFMNGYSSEHTGVVSYLDINLKRL